jgi:phage major head subunit gpT-like protein
MQHRLSLSTGTFKLLKVNEAGEFKEGSIGEGGEAYRVWTYGRIFSITRQALTNDDLGVFSDLPRTLGAAAAALEADVLAGLVTANPVMADGVAVFHATHGNVAAAGAAIDLTTLSAARVAMRRQTGPGGEALNIVPRFLVVSPEQETTADHLSLSWPPQRPRT